MAEIKVGDRIIHTNSCQKISGKVIRIVAEVEVDGLKPGMNVVPYETFNLTHEPGSVVALIERDGLVLSVTRRKKPENTPIEGNYSLVGGSIEPVDKDPYAALVREVGEESGVIVESAEKIFERVDETDGKIAWCFRVTRWSGEPRTMEPGVEVSWRHPLDLLTEKCTFADYNRRLFAKLNMIPDFAP